MSLKTFLVAIAAHKNNYEIIKLLLDRGATLPQPHVSHSIMRQIALRNCHIRICHFIGCEMSMRWLYPKNYWRFIASFVIEGQWISSTSKSLIDSFKLHWSASNSLSGRHKVWKSIYALSTFSICSFIIKLSWELRNLAFAEQESKAEYLELRRKCQQFAVDLLDQTRSSQELAIILNYDPQSPPYMDGDHMQLKRLEMAIDYKQKKVFFWWIFNFNDFNSFFRSL